MTGKEYAKKEYPNLEEGLKQILAKAFDMGKDNAERELEEKVQGYDRNRDRLISMGFPTSQSCKEYADKIKELEQQIKQMNEQEARDIRTRFPC